jgi:hypothetical protein
MPQLLQSWKMRSRCATVCGVTLSLEGSSGWSFGQGWPRMVQPKGELLLRPMWWLFPFQKPDTHSHLVLMPCFVCADSFTLPNSSDSRPAGIVVPITMSCRQNDKRTQSPEPSGFLPFAIILLIDSDVIWEDQIWNARTKTPCVS